jgi:hypothetical protein
MTGHAGFGGRYPCKGTFFYRGMAVTAVKAQLADVMPVTEWNFLFPDNTCLCYIWRSIDGEQEPDKNGDNYQTAEN